MLDNIPIIFDPINLKDFFLGGAIALALRRERIKAILDDSPVPNGDDG